MLNVALVGSGKFGQHFQRHLESLAQEGLIRFKGICVRSEETKLRLEKTTAVPVFTKVTTKFMQEQDCVFIVTPMETHYSLITEWIQHCHVFCEKPLTDSYKTSKMIAPLAKQFNHTVMCGHILRFHPLVNKLDFIIEERKTKIISIEGKLTIPIENDQGYPIGLELLHMHDITDFLIGEEPIKQKKTIISRLQTIEAIYSENIEATYTLGWQDTEKQSNYSVYLADGTRCSLNFVNDSLVIEDVNHKTYWYKLDEKPELILTEIITFFDVINNKTSHFPDAEVGARLVRIAEN